MKLSFHPEVRTDISGLYHYYREIDPDLALSLIEEYRAALAFVKTEPSVMRIFYGNDRRILLKRFKNLALVYEVFENEIRVKAVADLRRKPYGWSARS